MEQTPIPVADINDKSEQDCLARSIAGLQLFILHFQLSGRDYSGSRSYPIGADVTYETSLGSACEGRDGSDSTGS